MVSNEDIREKLEGKRNGINTHDIIQESHETTSDNFNIVCPECGTENPSISNFCSECGNTIEVKLGYVVCDLCYGIYELEKGESAEDFVNSQCHCGGNLAYIQDMGELEDLTKKCPICSHVNPYHFKRCEECGRCFDISIEYFESPFYDIEITPNVVRIYKKDDKKLTEIYQYDIDKINDFLILKDKISHKICFNYEKNDILFEISYKQADNLKIIFDLPSKLVVCPNSKCSYSELLEEGDNCPECKISSLIIDSDDYADLKNVKNKNKLVKQLKNKTEKKAKKEPFSLRKTIRFDKYESWMEKRQKKDIEANKDQYELKVTKGLIKMAYGITGQLELYEHKIIIRRKGKMAFFTHGWKGDKEILLNQISSIQLKKTDDLTSGYIQFAFLGGLESKRGLVDASIDENTITFFQFQEPDFIEIKELIESKMLEHQGLSTEKKEQNIFDDLEKLAVLRDKGIITEEEFQAKKKQILGL